MYVDALGLSFNRLNFGIHSFNMTEWKTLIPVQPNVCKNVQFKKPNCMHPLNIFYFSYLCYSIQWDDFIFTSVPMIRNWIIPCKFYSLLQHFRTNPTYFQLYVACWLGQPHICTFPVCHFLSHYLWICAYCLLFEGVNHHFCSGNVHSWRAYRIEGITENTTGWNSG